MQRTQTARQTRYVMTAIALQIEAYLKEKTFKCIKLNAQLTPAECCRRQGKKAETEQHFGYRLKTLQEPLARYCASGECEQGMKIKRSME